ncbi:MAG: caspase family protein, partial [Proteobacteria bacterium]|nr:caspase family protein [Pseudomonadota bacterium]
RDTAIWQDGLARARTKVLGGILSIGMKNQVLAIRLGILFGIMAITLLNGCGPAPQSNRSQAKDLAADRNARNVALIIGAPNDLGGVNKDVAEVSNMFRSPELGFQVVVKNRATSRDFIEQTEAAARSLDENSTLFWYYSGHGLQDGGLFAQDQQVVHFKQILAAIKRVRSKPFKRLIVVMDSCFSGQNVDGRGAIIPASVPASMQSARLTSAVGAVHNDLNSAAAASDDRPFEEALVIAAARRHKASLDAGAQYGGVFTASWRSVLTRQFQDRTKTIRNMVEATIAATVQNSQGQHTPVFRASPESLLNEPLIGPGSDSSLPSTVPTSGFDAFLALTGSDPATPYVLAGVSLTSGIDSAFVCQGEVSACRVMPKSQVLSTFSLTKLPQITDRLILKSRDSLKLESGVEYSVIFTDQSGAEKGTKRFRARVASGT